MTLSPIRPMPVRPVTHPDDRAPDWPSGVAEQQPRWADPEALHDVHRFLRTRPPLAGPESIAALHAALREVAGGTAGVLQAGDCAEGITDTGAGIVRRKAALVRRLAALAGERSGRPVVPVGRIAGQFAKPRSQDTELVDGRELPTYRGDLVNDPAPTTSARRAVPARLLEGYLAARRIVDSLGGGTRALWTSHEMLVLDYEVPLLRRAGGRTWLTSTHWPWIGERTRRPDGAHVELLSRVANPVACKVGPSATPEELVELCARLDPLREPGRLTFIARLGSENVTERLPGLLAAVARAGHPVIWTCDPMHGNTQKGPDGGKLRRLPVLTRETERFTEVVRDAGAVPGGLHLEATPDDVLECTDTDEGVCPAARGTSLCDPRLNERQAVALVDRWTG